MAELKLNGSSSQLSTDNPASRDLALVREACAFFAAASNELARSLSLVVHAEPGSAPALAAVAQRIAGEYGLHATFSRKGDSLILAIARTCRALPRS